MACAKHSNGRLFRFLTGSPYRIDKQYSVGCGLRPPGQSTDQGADPHRRSQQKTAATPIRAAAAVFPQQKTTESVLADPGVFPHLSSSSDLRIISSVQPSRKIPNDQLSLSTKPSRIQRRYRPGFSPGFLFSCRAVTASAGTQMEY